MTAPLRFQMQRGHRTPATLRAIDERDRYLIEAAAADRLRMLRQRISDLRNLCPSFEERHEANSVRGECERRLAKLTEHPSRAGYGLADDDPRVVREQQQLATLTAEAKRIDDLNTVRSAAWQAAANVLSNVEAYLRDGKPAGVVFEVCEDREPTLGKGETVSDAIERHRRRCRELKAAIHTIQSSCFPSSYCKQRAKEQIEMLAQRGAVSVSKLIEFDGEIEFATMQVQATVHNVGGGAVAFHEMPDVVGLIAFLHKPTLIAALDAEIDAEADDAAALSHEARQKAEAEIQGDLLDVERQEAALVWRAQSENLPVEHRSDTSPLALLGLRLVTAPATNPSPGSSPWHALPVIGRR